MDAVLKLCLDTTDVERAFNEIDERLNAYSEKTESVFGSSPGNADSSVRETIEDSELLRRILGELESISSASEGVAETVASFSEILNGIRQQLENGTFIQGVTAV